MSALSKFHVVPDLACPRASHTSARFSNSSAVTEKFAQKRRSRMGTGPSRLCVTIKNTTGFFSSKLAAESRRASPLFANTLPVAGHNLARFFRSSQKQ